MGGSAGFHLATENKGTRAFRGVENGPLSIPAAYGTHGNAGNKYVLPHAFRRLQELAKLRRAKC